MVVKSALLLTYLFGVLVPTILASSYDARAARQREPRSVTYRRPVSNMIYNDNWGGVLVSKEQGSIDFIGGQLVVPNVSRSQDDIRGVAAVLNVDGYTCSTQGFLQVGLDVVAASGATNYTFWAYWAGGSVLPIAFNASSGDHIELSISILSPTSAKVLVKNPTGQEVSGLIVWTPFAKYALCQMDAGWVIGALPRTANASSFYPLPHSGTVNFKLVWASLDSKSYSLSDTQTINIPFQTTSSIDPQIPSVTVQYTGP